MDLSNIIMTVFCLIDDRLKEAGSVYSVARGRL